MTIPIYNLKIDKTDSLTFSVKSMMECPSEHDTLTQCWVNVGRRLRRRPNINPALSQCTVVILMGHTSIS